jgi:hypothetical protein
LALPTVLGQIASLLQSVSMLNNSPAMPAEVRIANCLTTARHTYSEQQLNLFFCLLTKLQKVPAADRCYQLPRAEVERLMGKQLNSGKLSQQATGMQVSCWEYGSPLAPQHLLLFERVIYLKGQGIFEFILSEASLPFLFNLKGNFTSFNLATALRIRGSYSKRLYLLCAQWRDRATTPKYTLDYLRWMFALTDKASDATDKYKLFGHLHLRILKPAIKRLNAQTAFAVELVLYRKAHAVTEVKLRLRAELSTGRADSPSPVTGFTNSVTDRQLRAAAMLQQLDIVDPVLRQQILASDSFMDQTFSFMYKLKTDRHIATRNPGGLLLRILGLR